MAGCDKDNIHHNESENKEEKCKDTSSGSELQTFELNTFLREKLLDLPEVLAYIAKLQSCIERQRKKIRNLKLKLKKNLKNEVATQTCVDVDEDLHTKSISEEVKEAAELAMQKNGFIYEETSGLYYDYQSGYYYNAEYGLYYDGNTGTYMSYDQENKTYQFHSQVELQNVEDELQSSQTKTKRKFGQGKSQEMKRRKSKSDQEEEIEEGECSEDSWSVHKGKSGSSDDDFDENFDISKQWPPCMRIIIKQTSVENLKVGSLHVITFEGGTVGREGNHNILISDINVSKHHLKFSFDDKVGKYMVTDLGSRNGTLLNGKRMASSKQESDALEVIHGSHIQLGGTILLCHIHSGNQTCGLCEPGLLQINSGDNEFKGKTNKHVHHKEQLKKLKKKFGLNQSDQSNGNLAAGYVDRAHVRRLAVGSQNEHEKTHVASVDQSITCDNKGFKLLAKMGWTEGQSLGKDGGGLLEPINVQANPGTSGMGNTNEVPILKASKQNIWTKTQKRYEKLEQAPKNPIDTEDLDNLLLI